VTFSWGTERRIDRWSPGFYAEEFVFSPNGRTVTVRVGLSDTHHTFDHETGGWRTTVHQYSDVDECVLETLDLDTGQRRSLAGTRMRFCKDLVFHPDGRRLATVSAAGVQVWDVMKGSVLRTLSPNAYEQAVWSLDGKSLLVVKKDSQAEVFKTEGGTIREWPAPKREWNAFTLNPNGQWVITGGEDRMIHVRDVSSGKELARWQGHEAPITALTFSPDGKFLVSGARDGTLRVWNLLWIRAELPKLHPDLGW
jgi:WD40 repeat protein